MLPGGIMYKDKPHSSHGHFYTMFKPRNKQRKCTRRLLLHDVILAILVIFFVCWGFLLWDAFMGKDSARIYTCVPEQPLYITKENFFPEDQFIGIKERLTYGALSDGPTSLNQENFGRTSGLVVWFNLEGLETFRKHPKLQDMVAFFDRVRLNGTNAFVINVLACDSVTGRLEHEAASAGQHVDDTLTLFEMRLRSTLEFVSHQTTVLYISVPDEMRGGRLYINPVRVRHHLAGGLNKDGPGSTYSPDGQLDSVTVSSLKAASENQNTGIAGAPGSYDVSNRYFGPDLVPTYIQPQENMMVSFRGDALHKVEAFRSDLGRRRVSLVVEQYMIPQKMYWRTKKFWMSYKV